MMLGSSKTVSLIVSTKVDLKGQRQVPADEVGHSDSDRRLRQRLGFVRVGVQHHERAQL